MATTTGKKARRAGGTRFACKRMKAKTRRTKKFGRLAFSNVAKNVPEGAVRAADELTYQIAQEREANGWFPDSNVSVPGPTREAVEARRRAEEQAAGTRRREESAS